MEFYSTDGFTTLTSEPLRDPWRRSVLGSAKDSSGRVWFLLQCFPLRFFSGMAAEQARAYHRIGAVAVGGTISYWRE